MPNSFSVKASKFSYGVSFFNRVDETLKAVADLPNPFFIVDKNVWNAHQVHLEPLLTSPHFFFEATEETKSLENFPSLIAQLGELGIKRNHTLVAIGGGITQDVTCFLAANMFRGMRWAFLPTTLLAQADSCIGSKSSINVGSWKNILGTFTPPQRVLIAADFLKSLKSEDVYSGVGEMIKVHIIKGREAFEVLNKNYDRLFQDDAAMLEFIGRSLEIKKEIIEIDEFDEGPRNVMNYGHSFGHAIEAATNFGVPHGIAVTLGMDMANFVAWKLGRITEADYTAYSSLLKKNAGSFYKTNVRFAPFMSALAKDKKNVTGQTRVILLNSALKTEIVGLSDRAQLESICCEFFASRR